MNWFLEYYAAIYLYFSLRRLSQAILDNFFFIIKAQLHLFSDCLIKLKFGCLICHLNSENLCIDNKLLLNSEPNKHPWVFSGSHLS